MKIDVVEISDQVDDIFGETLVGNIQVDMNTCIR